MALSPQLSLLATLRVLAERVDDDEDAAEEEEEEAEEAMAAAAAAEAAPPVKAVWARTWARGGRGFELEEGGEANDEEEDDEEAAGCWCLLPPPPPPPPPPPRTPGRGGVNRVLLLAAAAAEAAETADAEAPAGGGVVKDCRAGVDAALFAAAADAGGPPLFVALVVSEGVVKRSACRGVGVVSERESMCRWGTRAEEGVSSRWDWDDWTPSDSAREGRAGLRLEERCDCGCVCGC